MAIVKFLKDAKGIVFVFFEIFNYCYLNQTHCIYKYIFLYFSFATFL